MRYGENILEVQAKGAWVCPPCRGLCNCSFHRIRAGWAPTGTLYRRAIAEGELGSRYLAPRADPRSDSNRHSQHPASHSERTLLSSCRKNVTWVLSPVIPVVHYMLVRSCKLQLPTPLDIVS